MSKISPCLWLDGEAEEAASFYISLLPNSRIERVQKNVMDSPAGKAGTVLVVGSGLSRHAPRHPQEGHSATAVAHPEVGGQAVYGR